MKCSMLVTQESFPLAKVFRISRGAKTAAHVVVVAITDGTHWGWGEAVPYNRYGESIESVMAQLKAFKASDALTDITHSRISEALPPGSARNALDCALWDLECKRQRKSINELVSIPAISHSITAQTLSVDTPEAMQKEARLLQNADLIKIKLDADSVLEKMQLIHAACPTSRFIIDANEGWSFELLLRIVDALAEMNVVLIEQPLPADQDDQLKGFNSPVPLCADESCHTASDIPRLKDSFDYVNIKLDKTGGLSEALALLNAAKQAKMGIMVGCMVGTSLAMAPAYSLCKDADFVDLDGPLLVAQDRINGFKFDNGIMHSHSAIMWGTADNTAQQDIKKVFADFS
ncbi:dipeptide epimerase [Alteromonas sediminis]|uniref:Dipeptide epimerase n=1 Tax=Alteromonas sediminis TaxID=2259342 RepID=A0A3N5Y256_9ALTE|nr:N-acetyl-D-Glu racemase DgcA [Alteromonas sediminis]RPJ67043.1 dipeptide epimerase [Alteromonas sediminis]